MHITHHHISSFYTVVACSTLLNLRRCPCLSARVDAVCVCGHNCSSFRVGPFRQPGAHNPGGCARKEDFMFDPQVCACVRTEVSCILVCASAYERVAQHAAWVARASSSWLPFCNAVRRHAAALGPTAGAKAHTRRRAGIRAPITASIAMATVYWTTCASTALAARAARGACGCGRARAASCVLPT